MRPLIHGIDKQTVEAEARKLWASYVIDWFPKIGQSGEWVACHPDDVAEIAFVK